MGYFPDIAESARLGFKAGREQAEGSNPLGNFVRAMLSTWQKKKEMEMEYEQKVGLEKVKSGIEQSSPLYQAQTKAYEKLATQREESLIDEQIKKDAWEKYQKGDKSPETLKTLGKFVSPFELIIAQNMGLINPDDTPTPDIMKPKGRIRVKLKKTGKTGTIDASEFDPKIYEKI